MPRTTELSLAFEGDTPCERHAENVRKRGVNVSSKGWPIVRASIHDGEFTEWRSPTGVQQISTGDRRVVVNTHYTELASHPRGLYKQTGLGVLCTYPRLSSSLF